MTDYRNFLLILCNNIFRGARSGPNRQKVARETKSRLKWQQNGPTRETIAPKVN